MSRSRSKQRDERATAEEESAYRGLAGTLMYLGNAVVPQAALTTSRMQKNLGDLRVKDIIDGIRSLKEILRLRPYISYLRPNTMKPVRIVSLRDAAHGGAGKIYGQTGGICRLLIDYKGAANRIVHPVSWKSHKQKKCHTRPS